LWPQILSKTKETHMASPTELLLDSQEEFTGFQTGITSDHNYIHQGKGFVINHTFSAVASAGVSYIGLTTPASTAKYIHFRPTTFSSSANLGRSRLLQVASFTGGTELFPQNNNQNRRTTSYLPTMKVWTGVTPVLTTDICSATAGGDFANQPAGDTVEILSSSALDITQSVTVYGTITGATTTVTSETIALDATDGTTVMPSVITTWETILGVELSAACVGTITIQEGSANADITTIAPAALSAGIVTPSAVNQDVKGLVPTHDCSGASTKKIAVIGTGIDGLAQSYVDDLNNDTEEAHGTEGYLTITKILIGDVEAARDATINIGSIVLTQINVGSGGTSTKSGGSGGSSENEIVLLPETDYVLTAENIGAVTASNLGLSGFWYSEDSGA